MQFSKAFKNQGFCFRQWQISFLSAVEGQSSHWEKLEKIDNFTSKIKCVSEDSKYNSQGHDLGEGKSGEMGSVYFGGLVSQIITMAAERVRN